MQGPPCPVCEPRGADGVRVWAYRGVIECTTCGPIRLRREGVQPLGALTPAEHAILRGVLAESASRGRDVAVELDEVSVRELLAMGPSTVTQKLDRLLLNLARDSPYPGAEFDLDHKTSLHKAYASRPEEFNYLVHGLVQAEWLERLVCQRLRLSANGWARVRELEANTPAGSTAFVAMWFSKETEDLYDDGIEPAIKETGWTPLRVDRKPSPQPIDDQIVVELQRARFVIADATGARPSVYWEAGYAYALGRPVIWTMRSEEEWQFDTRQFHHILWERPADVKGPLMWRILRLVGRGPD